MAEMPRISASNCSSASGDGCTTVSGTRWHALVKSAITTTVDFTQALFYDIHLKRYVHVFGREAHLVIAGLVTELAVHGRGTGRGSGGYREFRHQLEVP